MSHYSKRIVYNLRENLNVDWARKQREIQKRKNYEENQQKIGQNILNIEKTEEEFDWDQVKIPGLAIKGSTPQEMMTSYINWLTKYKLLGVSIAYLFREHQGLVTKNAIIKESMKYYHVSIPSL